MNGSTFLIILIVLIVLNSTVNNYFDNITKQVQIKATAEITKLQLKQDQIREEFLYKINENLNDIIQTKGP